MNALIMPLDVYYAVSFPVNSLWKYLLLVNVTNAANMGDTNFKLICDVFCWDKPVLPRIDTVIKILIADSGLIARHRYCSYPGPTELSQHLTPSIYNSGHLGHRPGRKNKRRRFVESSSMTFNAICSLSHIYHLQYPSFWITWSGRHIHLPLKARIILFVLLQFVLES